MKCKYLIIGGLLLLALTAILAACSNPTTPPPTSPPPPPQPTQAPCPTAVACPTAAACPECPKPVVQDVPFEALWAASPHADAKAAAFTHWDTADPKEIPVACARCHSTPGFQDFTGADGSKPGVVDKPAPIGTVITCVACHNTATLALASAVFPSGEEIKDLGPEAVCMQCHQGRESKKSVDEAIKKVAVADEDTVSKDLPFTNIHYLAAAATLYGMQAKGGYEYDGKPYDVKNRHVSGYDTCVGCHNTHSLEVKVDSCKSCHTNVKSKDDLKNIRMNGSTKDYNGNGNTTEGIYFEIEGLQKLLLQAIQSYAKDVANTQIAYSPDAYPYFFIDTNGNGQVDKDEATAQNGYKAFTPRLLKAAYNYQVSIKDPGAFAHNAKYIIELLYDSIDNLNTKLSTPVDLTKASRIDAGHFAGSEMAFRDWDSAGEVPGRCARCHSATGLPQYLKEGVTISNPLSNGLSCSTCHDDLTKFTRRQVKDGKVQFPSGLVVSFGPDNEANLCIECHQGRESTTSVNKAVAGLQPDTISDKLGFLNIHFFAAGASLFGTEAKGAYEYTGQKYNGRNMHQSGFDTCLGCHDTHGLNVQVEKCGACHTTVKTVDDLKTIRMSTVDYNGNGDVKEGIAAEVATLQEKLYAAIQAFAKDKVKTPIVYSQADYPYFFTDTNGNGKADPDELKPDNGYKTWTPRLLEAAYNYQYSVKDPGVFAHNSKYILQILYDSIKDIGGSVQGLTRSEVK